MGIVMVDPELQALIPPPSADELAQLEANIMAEGCREALVVWDYDGLTILLDGHNRLKICEKHSLGYKTISCDIEDRDEAIRWIITNQLGRRNLTDAQRVKLALRLRPHLEEKAKERQQEHGGTAPGKSLKANLPEVIKSPAPQVRDQIAALAGVSARTVDRAALICQPLRPIDKTL